MKNAKLFRLNLNDFWKGLVLSVLVAILTVAYNSIQAGGFNIDWEMVATTAILTAISYLLKNLTTNSDGKILKPEEK